MKVTIKDSQTLKTIQPDVIQTHLQATPGFLTKKRKKGVKNCENVYVESI